MIASCQPTDKSNEKIPVLDRAYVYIKSHTGFYLTTPCYATYCVAASKEKRLRQVFVVHFSKRNGKNCMHLEIANNYEYLREYRYLYHNYHGSLKMDRQWFDTNGTVYPFPGTHSFFNKRRQQSYPG